MLRCRTQWTLAPEEEDCGGQTAGNLWPSVVNRLAQTGCCMLDTPAKHYPQRWVIATRHFAT